MPNRAERQRRKLILRDIEHIPAALGCDAFAQGIPQEADKSFYRATVAAAFVHRGQLRLAQLTRQGTMPEGKQERI